VIRWSRATRLCGGLLNAGPEAEIEVLDGIPEWSVSPFLKAIRRKVTNSIVISPVVSGDVAQRTLDRPRQHYFWPHPCSTLG
jgi:hypothetical protein